MLYTGKPVTRDASERVKQYVNSSADDAIFATTWGLIKPAKRVTGPRIKKSNRK